MELGWVFPLPVLGEGRSPLRCGRGCPRRTPLRLESLGLKRGIGLAVYTSQTSAPTPTSNMGGLLHSGGVRAASNMELGWVFPLPVLGARTHAAATSSAPGLKPRPQARRPDSSRGHRLGARELTPRPQAGTRAPAAATDPAPPPPTAAQKVQNAFSMW